MYVAVQGSPGRVREAQDISGINSNTAYCLFSNCVTGLFLNVDMLLWAWCVRRAGTVIFCVCGDPGIIRARQVGSEAFRIIMRMHRIIIFAIL